MLGRHPCRLVLLIAAISGGVLSSAQAADLGGNCCADLEERIAELEWTDARKGNRKVSLTISGFGPTLSFSRGSFSVTSFSNYTPAWARTPSTPFVISGGHVAVVDTSLFAQSDTAYRSAFEGIAGILRHRDACTPGLPQGSDAACRGVWVEGLGSFNETADSTSTFGSSQSLSGVLAGVDTPVAAGLSLGAFGGYAAANSDADYDAQSMDTNVALFGVYGRYVAGSGFVDFDIAGAAGRTDEVRSIASNAGGVNGFEHARADYSAISVSPALRAGIRFGLSEGLELIPAAEVRGQFLHLDGFSELGSSANLTVSGRDLSAIESRAELTLSRELALDSGSLLTLQGTVGVLAYERIGGDGVDAGLLGRHLQFSSTADKSDIAGFARVTAAWQLSAMTAFDASVEGIEGGDRREILFAAGVHSKF